MRILLVPLLLVAASGCLGGDAPQPLPGEDNASHAPTAPATDAEPEPIVVAVGRGGAGVPPTVYTLSPATLELRVGTSYSLTLRNDDPAAGHDLAIEGLDVHIATIPAGATSEPVVFTPTEAGTFRMYCTIGGDGPLGHDAQGMHGEVVVR